MAKKFLAYKDIEGEIRLVEDTLQAQVAAEADGTLARIEGADIETTDDYTQGTSQPPAPYLESVAPSLIAINTTQDIVFHRIRQDLSEMNGVKNSLVAINDGFILYQSDETTLEQYAKTSSAMLRIADAAILKMGWNSSERIVVDYPGERLVATRAGPKALVAVLTQPETNLDPIQSELEKAAEKVREII